MSFQVKVDGAWIDMNEPSNFDDGQKDGCPKSDLNNPPYVPSSLVGGSLYHKTVCPSALHASGHRHYDLHNLFALTEAMNTNFALKTIRQQRRPFIISRSTFSGHGHFAGHWTGDISSTWDDMKITIAGVLDFNMFGIPMVGADICGFAGNTTAALCQRWMELGAFYPFSRSARILHISFTRGD